ACLQDVIQDMKATIGKIHHQKAQQGRPTAKTAAKDNRSSLEKILALQKRCIVEGLKYLIDVAYQYSELHLVAFDGLLQLLKQLHMKDAQNSHLISASVVAVLAATSLQSEV